MCRPWILCLCLWFRASLICVNNCPTRCNTKQSIYYSASSLYMFRVSTTPIIRGTQNCNYSLRYCAASSLQRGQAWPRWREVAAQKLWSLPEAVVTVLCTPDDGCGWHPKHVEWTCRIINRLLCVASRWTIINMYLLWIELEHFMRCSEVCTTVGFSFSAWTLNPEDEGKLFLRNAVSCSPKDLVSQFGRLDCSAIRFRLHQNWQIYDWVKKEDKLLNRQRVTKLWMKFQQFSEVEPVNFYLRYEDCSTR